jgi:hypothetical protein
MAIRMYVEHAVIISILLSHNRVEIDLGKKALQLLEGHTQCIKRFYGNRTNPSSQAPPNFPCRTSAGTRGIIKNVHLAIDYQFVANPACNSDRGPLNIFASRFHFQF